MKAVVVLEGGSYRGLFSAGVLDVFMEENIHVDGFIGVSAGALFSPNYFSKQKGRVVRYTKRFCKDPRNMSLLSYFLTGNIVNKQFAFYDVTLKYDVFDNETFIQNNTGFYATATNVETGEAEYLKMNDIVHDMEILRATSAIPFFSKLVEIDGKKYLDGGVSDSVPLKQAQKMGYDKIIIISTRPYDFVRKPFPNGMMKLVGMKYRKYPKFIETMQTLHTRYNENREYMLDLENKGEIFVIRPPHTIDVKTVENNPNRLQGAYDLGVQCGKEQLALLKQYLEK